MFTPPKWLLEKIGFKKTQVEIVLPTYSDAGDYAYILSGVLAAIEEFLKVGVGDKQLDKQHVGIILLEMLMNAAEHGNKKELNKKIHLGCWFGDNGVLFGVYDEGNFFREQSTKELIESRTVLSSTKANPSGIGLACIYRANDVYVSTKENIFYVIILSKSMIIKRRNEY